MTDALLQVCGLSKRYGNQQALDNVELKVAEGEFVALLGPNGAGKTTLFQLLTALFMPDAGTAYIAGHDIRRGTTAALAALGVVFQQPTVDLEMTVIGNLRFHARLHGMARKIREPRIDDELNFMGLGDQTKDRVRTLSGGNRRRVELARALLHEPRLLLMDEPSVGLDPASRRDLLARVDRIRRTRRLGVLWATHLVDEAERADRVIVIESGRILVTASPQELQAMTGTANLNDAFLALTKGQVAAARETT